jgi:hypothetical protein
MKRYEDAISDFSEVIKLDRRAVDAYCNRGSAYFELGKVESAIQDFNSALRINPRDADLYYNRAVAYLAKGQNDLATKDFEMAAGLGHAGAKGKLQEPGRVAAFPKPSTEPSLAPTPGPSPGPSLPPAPASSPGPPLPPAPAASLKMAAVNCQAGEFGEYMPPAVKERVIRFEGIEAELNRALGELDRNAKQLFGNRVRRTDSRIRFRIEGKDPRWVKLLGPQWANLTKQRPKEPRFFEIHAAFGWKEECRVLQRFQACMENPSFCREASTPGSALQMKKLNGAWRLVDGKTPQEWKQGFNMGEGLIEIIQWANKHLMEKKGQMPYEQMILSLAEGYTQRLQKMTGPVQPAKARRPRRARLSR